MGAPRPRVEGNLVEVFRDQRPGLWGYLYRGAGSAAEDLLQETFLRTWDHRDDLGHPSNEEEREGIRRYLWRVARNLVIDEIRMRRRHGEQTAAGGPEDPATDPSPGPAESLEMADALRVLRETVGTLPNKRVRRCLLLWMEGRDLDVIAKDVALGIGQVRGLLQRGRSEVVRRASDRIRPGPAAPAAERRGNP